jgi:hypothetical protein
MADPGALVGGTGADDNPDAATATTPSSWAVPSIPTSGELNAMHNEERGEDTLAPAMVELFPWEYKASPSDPLFSQSSAIKSIKIRPPHGDHDKYNISALSGTEKMGFVTLSHDLQKTYLAKLILSFLIAMTLKKRELD